MGEVSMSDEDTAKIVERGDFYINSRSNIQSALRSLTQTKTRLEERRTTLVAEFGAAAAEVAEIEAVQNALRTVVTDFAAGF